MTLFKLPTEEECIITVERLDGTREDLQIFEVFNHIQDSLKQASVSENGRSSVDIFIDIIFEKYNVTLNPSSAQLFQLEVHKMLSLLKKKCVPLPNTSDTTGSETST